MKRYPCGSRSFLGRSVVVGAMAGLALVGAPASPSTPVRVAIDPAVVAGAIGPEFVGFGYETSAVALPAYFSGSNPRLVNLYRGLTAAGLVRIGGNISDHTKYQPNGPAVVSPQTGVTIIDRAALARLADFLQATGWKAMWGLNLGTGTAGEAVEEARAVTAALGDRLHSLEIGNEVDLLPRFHGEYEPYHEAYRHYKAAIREALPGVPFSGPDVARKTDWVAAFARAEAPDVRCLTEHYYRSGAKKPDATIATLLAGDPAWDAVLSRLRETSATAKVPYRINETNSFYGGGKKGVSDTFGAALWCLDFLHGLAAHGCSGVNIETDLNQFAWTSHYSPIVRDERGACRATAVYYGMLAFALPGPGKLVAATVEKTDLLISAYAMIADGGQLWVTLLNRDAARDAVVAIETPALQGGRIFRLVAPRLESTDGVTLGGSEVSDQGKWAAAAREVLEIEEGTATLSLPHASAAVIRLERRRKRT